MSTPSVASEGCCLRNRFSFSGSGWKDTGGYLSKTVTVKTDTEGKLSKEKEIEVQNNVEIELFSKKLIFRTINKLINADITSELRSDLKELKKYMGKFDDNLADLVGIKLRPYQVALAPGEENGKEYQRFMIQAVDEVANDIEGFYERAKVVVVKKTSSLLGAMPPFFFDLLSQHRYEAQQNLPDEDSFFVNPTLIEKYPEKYQIQRLGMQVAQWGFGIGLVVVGSYSVASTVVIMLNKGDTAALFNLLVSTAMNQHNMTKAEAVDRIQSDPDFVTTLGNGSEPKMDGSLLGNFGGAEKAMIMSALALANQFHLTEYVGQAGAMTLVKLKRTAVTVLGSAFDACCRRALR
ncbi:hypothetical protein [Endozoicomonas elysicola]|uniref:Uncharacterized protein n=1 Tax=Endozoicomonas elysicola TaxID=305900 RepID=A0A081K8V1_9GAMM|nr:hypothetical protein [Endozoicomonas elysicola]KEI70577.1 hypothetical protein GV64_07340 [Endozoicomonas elysicola]